MCTVSYLPLSEGGCMITSNRDETPLRNATEIRHDSGSTQTLIYPVDPGAGGTWICMSDAGITGCLLNGAFVPFTPDPKYTFSRGRVLLNAMSNPAGALFDPDELRRTAPFTLVMSRSCDLTEYIWDGGTLFTRILDPQQPAFWSSVTLYPEAVRLWRNSLFSQWLDMRDTFTQDDIMQFHRYGSDDAWNGFVMNRKERVRTLSITSVRQQNGKIIFRHQDLLSDRAEIVELQVRSQDVEKN